MGSNPPFPESPCDIITVGFSPPGHLTKVNIKLQEEKEAKWSVQKLTCQGPANCLKCWELYFFRNDKASWESVVAYRLVLRNPCNTWLEAILAGKLQGMALAKVPFS